MHSLYNDGSILVFCNKGGLNMKKCICAVLTFVLPAVVMFVLPPSFLRLLAVCVVSLLWSVACVYYVGLEKEERTFFMNKAKQFLAKRLR